MASRKDNIPLADFASLIAAFRMLASGSPERASRWTADQRRSQIIDDNPSMLRSIRRLLNAAGFSVETFPSAEAFLEEDGCNRAACVVLDIHLPGMSGFELRRHLTAAGSGLPVIFITAITDEDLQGAASTAWLCRLPEQAVRAGGAGCGRGKRPGQPTARLTSTCRDCCARPADWPVGRQRADELHLRTISLRLPSRKAARGSRNPCWRYPEGCPLFSAVAGDRDGCSKQSHVH